MKVVFFLIFLLFSISLCSYEIHFIPSKTNPERIIIRNLEASYVQIAGNWNNWAGTSIKGKIDREEGILYRNHNNDWIYDFQFFINGNYKFKLIVDGKWKEKQYTFNITNSPILKFYDSITYEDTIAEQVIIAGTWNNWAGTEKGYLDESLGKMFQNEEGIWHYVLTPLKIKPGIYKYKFIVDGKWTYGTPNFLILKQ